MQLKIEYKIRIIYSNSKDSFYYYCIRPQLSSARTVYEESGAIIQMSKKKILKQFASDRRENLIRVKLHQILLSDITNIWNKRLKGSNKAGI